jgi:cell division protein FtsB
MRRPLTILVAALLCCSITRADTLSYVSDSELESEAARRDADIARTRDRIALLSRKEHATLERIEKRRAEIAQIEETVSERAKLFYRLSRHGGSLRHLLGSDSDSAITKLRRLFEMRHLLITGLEDRRDAGLNLTDAEAILHRVREDTVAARQMLEQLTQARDALAEEIRRRVAPTDL